MNHTSMFQKCNFIGRPSLATHVVRREQLFTMGSSTSVPNLVNYENEAVKHQKYLERISQIRQSNSIETLDEESQKLCRTQSQPIQNLLYQSGLEDFGMDVNISAIENNQETGEFQDGQLDDQSLFEGNLCGESIFNNRQQTQPILQSHVMPVYQMNMAASEPLELKVRRFQEQVEHFSGSKHGSLVDNTSLAQKSGSRGQSRSSGKKPGRVLPMTNHEKIKLLLSNRIFLDHSQMQRVLHGRYDEREFKQFQSTVIKNDAVLNNIGNDPEKQTQRQKLILEILKRVCDM